MGLLHQFQGLVLRQAFLLAAGRRPQQGLKLLQPERDLPASLGGCGEVSRHCAMCGVVRFHGISAAV